MLLTQFAGPQPGLALTELIATFTLLAVLVQDSLPSPAVELDTFRLKSASQATAATLNAALMTAETLQEAVEIIVSVRERRISTRSIGSDITLRLDLPDGIAIATDSGESSFIIRPNGKIPAIKVSLTNKNGVGRQIWVNPASRVVHQKAYQSGT